MAKNTRIAVDVGGTFTDVVKLDTSSGELIFDKIDLNLSKGDKVVLLSKASRAATAFYEVITRNIEPDSGDYKWGVTTSQGYLPLENLDFFKKKSERLAGYLSTRNI